MLPPLWKRTEPQNPEPKRTASAAAWFRTFYDLVNSLRSRIALIVLLPAILLPATTIETEWVSRWKQ
jgi:hypothetical protein